MNDPADLSAGITEYTSKAELRRRITEVIQHNMQMGRFAAGMMSEVSEVVAIAEKELDRSRLLMIAPGMRTLAEIVKKLKPYCDGIEGPDEAKEKPDETQSPGDRK